MMGKAALILLHFHWKRSVFDYKEEEIVLHGCQGDVYHWKKPETCIICIILYQNGQSGGNQMNQNRKPIDYAKASCETMMRKFAAQDLPPKGHFHYHQGVFLSGVYQTYRLLWR